MDVVDEDVSARVLLKRVLHSESARSPVTRSASHKPTASPVRRSSRVRNVARTESPLVTLQNKLKQKLHEAADQSPLPPSKKRRSQHQTVKTPAVASSSLYDEDVTPRGLLRGIIQTEAEASLLLSGQPVVPETNQEPVETSLRSNRQSEGPSDLELPDLVTEPLSNLVRGMSRRRPPPTFNVSAFERQLNQQSGEEKDNDATQEDTDLTMEQDLSAGCKSVLSLTLKTPFVNVQSERGGLRRKAANRRQPSVDEFDEAIQKRMQKHSSLDYTVVPDGKTLGDSDWQRFTLGLSNVTVPDQTTDIVLSNTELYPQPTDSTSDMKGPPEMDRHESKKGSETDEEVGDEHREEEDVDEHREEEDVDEHREEEDVDEHREEEDMDEHREEEDVDEHREEEDVDEHREEEDMDEHREEEDVDDHREEEDVDEHREEEDVDEHRDEEDVDDHQGKENEDLSKICETEPFGTEMLQTIEDPATDSQLQKKEEMDMITSSQEKETFPLSLDEIPFAPTQPMAEPVAQIQEQDGCKSDIQEVEMEKMEWRESGMVEFPSRLSERITRRAYRSESGTIMPGVTAGGRSTKSLGAELYTTEKDPPSFTKDSCAEEFPCLEEEPYVSPASPSVSATLKRFSSVTHQTSLAEGEGNEGKGITEDSEDENIVPQSPTPNSPDAEMEQQEEEEEVEEEEEEEEGAHSEELSMQTPAFIRQRKEVPTPSSLHTPTVLKVVNAGPASKVVKPRRKQKNQTTSDVLPKSYVMSVFKHFAKTKVANDVYPIINEILQKYFDRLADDLEAYSAHARRKTIEVEDVELLMRRQRLLTGSYPVNVLIEKFLPLEYRKLLIPVAVSGNKVIPNQRR